MDSALRLRLLVQQFQVPDMYDGMGLCTRRLNQTQEHMLLSMAVMRRRLQGYIEIPVEGPGAGAIRGPGRAGAGAGTGAPAKILGLQRSQ